MALLAVTHALSSATSEVSAFARASGKGLKSAMSESTSAPATMVGVLWRAAIAWGVVAVVLGAAALLWPTITVVAAAILFGGYLLVSGVVQVVAAFGLDVAAGSRILLFISGVVSVILAILAFRYFREGYGVWLLAIWIGIGFIFSGTSDVVIGVSHRDLPARGWQILSGAVSVVAGVVILAWPIDSIVTLAMVAGAFLIVIGVMQIAKALQFRSGANAVARGLGIESAR